MKTRSNTLFCFFAAVLALIALQPNSARACADIDGILDLNCDQKLVVVTFGDSITSGVQDLSVGGYPARLGRKLPNARVVNMGKAGEKSRQGRTRAASQLPGQTDADFIVVLEGVNDYFLEDRSSSKTRFNLRSIVSSGEASGAITILAKLTQVRRDFQQPWVISVNRAIASDTRIDFFALGKEIISGDNLHPDGTGYERMADLVLQTLREISQQERPVDADKDGIFDFAENRFGASAGNPDTDNDGLLDGDEVFVHNSNPNNRDTDGDSFEDFFEVNALGSDPASPVPSAPTVTTLEVF